MNGAPGRCKCRSFDFAQDDNSGGCENEVVVVGLVVEDYVQEGFVDVDAAVVFDEA
jgi:hypothetical protein